MKTKTTAALALLLASGVGCGKQNPEPAAAPPAAQQAAPAPAQVAPPTPNETQAASATEAAKENKDDIAAGEAVDETGQAPPPNAAADQANIQLAKAFANAPAGADPAARWTQGTHYQPVTPAQPTSAPPDKIEVLEIFWYGCPHCYGLEPYIENWEPKRASYIQFTRVPVMWGPVHKLHARLYYTLLALNRSDLHLAAFRESQVGNHLIGRDVPDTERVQMDFAKRHGIDSDTFSKAYRSQQVIDNLQRAEDLVRRYRVEGVPKIVVNGKYISDVAMAGGQSQLLSLANDLAAREHKK